LLDKTCVLNKANSAEKNAWNPKEEEEDDLPGTFLLG